MATTSNTYTGNGSNKLFSITFPYIDTSDIYVYLNDVLQTNLIQYTFANATTIEFVTAPGSGVTVDIIRSTQKELINSTFFPGSSIKANDLNENFDQLLYISQENTNAVNAGSGTPSTIPATNVLFASSGTGAVVRTVDSKLKEVVSIKDFGAKGDFTDDSTPALLAAIQYVNSMGGGTVYVPAGIYKVATQLDFTLVGALANITIRGASKFDSIFKFADNFNGASNRWIYDITNVHNGFVIESIGFNGNEANMGNAEILRDKVIKFNCNNFTLRDCYFFNEGGRGIVTVLGNNIYLQDNIFKNIGCRTGAGVYATDSSSLHPGNADSPSSYVVVTGNISINAANDSTQHSFIDAIIGEGAVFANNVSYGDNQGLLLTTRDGNTNNVTIAHNNFNVRARGIYMYTNPLSGSALGSFANIDVSNNTINAPTCILIDGGALGAGAGGNKVFKKSQISNNILGAATFGTVSGNYHVRLRYAVDCTINGNVSHNPSTSSFFVDNSEYILVNNNTSNNANGHGLEISSVNYMTISSNVILNSSQTTNDTSSCIKLTSPCTFIDIINNRLGASNPSLAKRPKYGIVGQDLAAITDVNICNNIIRHAVTASINDDFAAVVNMVITDNVGFNDAPSTPAQITAAQSSYQGGRHADVWRLSSDASRTIQGIQAGGARWNGKIISIVNVGTNNIVLANESASAASASYRMINSTGADVTLAANQTIKYMYDTTSSRWRQIA